MSKREIDQNMHTFLTQFVNSICTKTTHHINNTVCVSTALHNNIHVITVHCVTGNKKKTSFQRKTSPGYERVNTIHYCFYLIKCT